MAGGAVYEVRPRKGQRGVDLISDALPFGRLWYDGPNAIANAIGYAEFYSRSHDAVIRVYDEPCNVIQTHCSNRSDARRTPPLCLSDACSNDCSNDFSTFYH